jgi:hypothetical protein
MPEDTHGVSCPLYAYGVVRTFGFDSSFPLILFFARIHLILFNGVWI